MALQHIEVISIPVKDQDNAKEFYLQKLGFRLLNDSPFEAGKRWVQLAISEDSRTSITLVTWFDKMPPGCVQGLIIATDDIEASYQALKNAGVDITPVYETPWGKFANFKDPDGNGWGLHQP